MKTSNVGYPRRRPPRRRHLALVLVALSLGTACGGPEFGLRGHLKEAPVDIRFGAQNGDADRDLVADPARNIGPGFPSVFTAPPLIRRLPNNPPAVACPEAGPFEFPEIASSPTATAPPKAAVYPYRYAGRVTETLPNGQKRIAELPTAGTQEVRNVAAAGDFGGFSFELVERYNATVTTTALRVEPTGPTGGQLPNQPPPIDGPAFLPDPPDPVFVPTPAAGVFVDRITTMYPNGSTDSFKPVISLLVFAFPAKAGESVRSVGVDGAVSSAVVLRSTAVDRERIDACGTVLEAWKVRLVGDVVDARDRSLASTSFDQTIYFATQYGALPVAQEITQRYRCGDANASSCVSRRSFTIGTKPGAGR